MPELKDRLRRDGSAFGALAAVDDVRARTTQFDKAEPDALDKVFGRGQYAAA